MSPLKTAITRSRGPLFKFLAEGSLLEVRPMSINKPRGLRCKFAPVDEWLYGDIREDVIEQGASNEESRRRV